MKHWRILFLIAASATLEGLTTHSSQRATSCYTGEKTLLAANQCVNVWPVEDAKFRWTDMHATCNPASPVCDSTQVWIAQNLNTAECKEVQILNIIPHDRLAKIRCIGESSGRPSDYLINLDSLACNPPTSRNPEQFKSKAEAPSPETQELGKLIVSRAEQAMFEMRDAVAQDTQRLLSLVRNSDPSEFHDRVVASNHEITGLFRRVRASLGFDDWCEPDKSAPPLSDDAVRAQRTCRLLKAASETGLKLINEMTGDPSSTRSRARFSDGAALKNLVIRYVSSENPYDQTQALATRMLILYAFKRDDSNLPRQLKLIRRSTETGTFFWELNSGFVFGGRRLLSSGGGYDCSDFVASILGVRGTMADQISTRNLAAIERHLSGEAPRERLPSSLNKLAKCFTAVDVRDGEPLEPGDLVISSNELLKDEHLTVVKQYSGDGTIQTIEDSGGEANTIMSKTRPLFEPKPRCSTQEHGLPLRADLHYLRMKAPPEKVCSLSIARD